ncbi:type II toxin-antitoxin system RelE/ParE family toxin [Pararhizobium sp. YC-54]|uniref:type II toxin-antitoxin system RelE/ParE family toxin n=1 Tax=Pararhizobium sp. YC-54 TaxID=2986920 RepID=UPI0021F789D6|nr:type II toxin-antitoxin system RelE/ParE family toxin [Pararhizobium sp. YC-54]MCV9996806.1 type II toxin-antitoxin system RelE/ParE family toxin [Pararhizobium sp. YC-54]
MTPVKLSKDAADYVRQESDYLRRQNPAAAKKFSLAMKSAKRMLQSFPEAGNSMHGLQIAGSLTLVVGDLLDYLYDGSQVDVILIRHGRMLARTPDVELDIDLEEGLGSVAKGTRSSF